MEEFGILATKTRGKGTRQIRVILYASAPGDCAKSKRWCAGRSAKSKGESPQQKRNSKPDWPRVMRSAPRGARRSVDRGACRPAIEPRKYSKDQGADAVTLCGRQHAQTR